MSLPDWSSAAEAARRMGKLLDERDGPEDPNNDAFLCRWCWHRRDVHQKHSGHGYSCNNPACGCPDFYTSAPTPGVVKYHARYGQVPNVRPSERPS